MSEQQQDDGIVDDTLLLDHHQLNTNAREWIPSTVRQEENKKAAAVAAAVVSTLKVGKEFIPSGRYSTTTNESTAAGVPFHSTDTSNNVMATARYPKNNKNVAVGDGPRSYYSPTNDSPWTFNGYEKRSSRSSIHSLGCEELLWNYYRQATFDTLREMDPSDPLRKAVPTNFVNIYCLDRTTTTTTNIHPKTATVAGTFGYPSHVFKVVSTEDGCVYCLRRFDNTKLSNRIAATVTERWASVAHPGICTLHQCFLSQRAGFFLHEYCIGSSTTSITQFYQLSPTFTTTNTTTNTISERLLWSYIVQLTSILRYLHSRGLACRSLHPNHVLLTDAGNSRIRLSSCGILDALEFEARKSIAELQQEDMLNLGRLILSIATTTKITSTTNTSTLRLCEAFLVQRFSSDLFNLVRALLYSGINPSSTSSSSPGTSNTAYGIPPHPHLLNIHSLCSMISHHVWDELDIAHTVTDAYSEELSKCYDNTRTLRLLIKLGWINERPEFGMDTQWSETGDRYVIKLFRDYVFHQAREDGSPVLDLGHIITSLNKLDAADPEKIVLVSREGESLLVVSYADISRCVEEAYQELCSADTKLGVSTITTTSTSTIGDVQPRLTTRTNVSSPLVSSSGIPTTKTTNTTTTYSLTTPPSLVHHQGNQNLTQQNMYQAVRSLTSPHQPPISMPQQKEHSMGYRGKNIW